MTNDLVARLRKFEGSDYVADGDFPTCGEAADRIEELEEAFKETIIAFDKALYSGELDMKFSAYCMTIQDSNKRIVGMKTNDQ